MSVLDARGALVRLCGAMIGDIDRTEAIAYCREIIKALEQERPATVAVIRPAKPARRARSAGRRKAA